MPEYTFQIVIILIRDDTELSLIKTSHSLYASETTELVFKYAKPFTDVGYKIHKFYMQNYELVAPSNSEHG